MRIAWGERNGWEEEKGVEGDKGLRFDHRKCKAEGDKT